MILPARLVKYWPAPDCSSCLTSLWSLRFTSSPKRFAARNEKIVPESDRERNTSFDVLRDLEQSEYERSLRLKLLVQNSTECFGDFAGICHRGSEDFRRERLSPVAHRVWRVRMHFHDEAVRSGGDRGRAHGRNQ